MTTPLHILLVEDNPGDADLTRDALETSKVQLQLSVVIDGAEALDYLFRRGEHVNAQPPDLILLDLNLPRLDGRRVLSEIKVHDRLKTIPVLVLTSSESEKDILQSYRLGANCYLSKPVDLYEFQSIVRSIEGFWFTSVKLP